LSYNPVDIPANASRQQLAQDGGERKEEREERREGGGHLEMEGKHLKIERL